jgi:hypothetical protein
MDLSFIASDDESMWRTPFQALFADWSRGSITIIKASGLETTIEAKHGALKGPSTQAAMTEANEQVHSSDRSEQHRSKQASDQSEQDQSKQQDWSKLQSKHWSECRRKCKSNQAPRWLKTTKDRSKTARGLLKQAISILEASKSSIKASVKVSVKASIEASIEAIVDASIKALIKALVEASIRTSIKAIVRKTTTRS